ncbi:TPA: ead/Ea22-like family protein [Escherichia coli]
MTEGMIKDLVASGHALADDMTGSPSVLVRCLAAQLEVQLVRANALAEDHQKAIESIKQADAAVKLAHEKFSALEHLLMLPVDDDLLTEQELKDYGVDIDALNAFKFLTGPETVLALLDERERNQQYIKRRDQENEDIALTVGKLRVELEAEKQRAKVLFMENARLKSGIAGLIHLGIRYADVEVMKIAGDAQLSTPCTDSIINSIATGIRIKGGE